MESKHPELRQLIEDKLGPRWGNVPWQPYTWGGGFKLVELPDGMELPCTCGFASKGGFCPGELTGFEAVMDDTSVKACTLTVSVNVQGEVHHRHCGAMVCQIGPWQSYRH